MAGQVRHAMDEADRVDAGVARRLLDAGAP